MSEKKKNVNVLRIEGDHDKLMTIMQRFATFGVKFEYEDEDESERRKLSVPETQVNTTQRLQKVVESGASAQMAPNLVDPDALPNDKYDKMQRTINAGQGEFAGNEERKEQAKKESEKQVKDLAEFERKHANVQGDASLKEKNVESNKKDKGAESRKTK